MRTMQQANFVVDLTQPTSNTTRAIKNRRVCYFMPAWMRDGHASQGAADLHHFGIAVVTAWCAPGHPHYERGQAARAVFTQRKFEEGLKS